MKYLALVVFAVALALCAARPEEKKDGEKYTGRFDSINIQQILSTDRLFRNYFNCLMDKGKCTPEGKELKRLLPDALKTNCEKCTEKQREGVDHVLKHMINKRKEEWKQLQLKYDPDNIYVSQYREFAKTRGIEI